jgi:hypothetical protein
MLAMPHHPHFNLSFSSHTHPPKKVSPLYHLFTPAPEKEKLPPSPARERIKTFAHSFKEF